MDSMQARLVQHRAEVITMNSRLCDQLEERLMAKIDVHVGDLQGKIENGSRTEASGAVSTSITNILDSGLEDRLVARLELEMASLRADLLSGDGLRQAAGSGETSGEEQLSGLKENA